MVFEDALNDAVLAVLGESVTYTRATGGDLVITAVLNSGERVTARGLYYEVFAKLSSFGVQDPAKGDTVSIANRVFVVADVKMQPDGGVLLELRKTTA